MTDKIQQYKESITFVFLLALGTLLICMGVFVESEAGLIALGAGAIGIPGMNALGNQKGGDNGEVEKAHQ